jgi:hypothetical protein
MFVTGNPIPSPFPPQHQIEAQNDWERKGETLTKLQSED